MVVTAADGKGGVASQTVFVVVANADEAPPAPPPGTGTPGTEPPHDPDGPADKDAGTDGADAGPDKKEAPDRQVDTASGKPKAAASGANEAPASSAAGGAASPEIQSLAFASLLDGADLPFGLDQSEVSLRDFLLAARDGSGPHGDDDGATLRLGLCRRQPRRVHPGTR